MDWKVDRKLIESKLFRMRRDGPQTHHTFPSIRLVANANITVRTRTGTMN